MPNVSARAAVLTHIRMHLEKCFTHNHTDDTSRTTQNILFFVERSWMKCETRNTKQYWCALETKLHIEHKASAASSRQKLKNLKQINQNQRKISKINKTIIYSHSFDEIPFLSALTFFWASFRLHFDHEKIKIKLPTSCSVIWWVCIHEIELRENHSQESVVEIVVHCKFAHLVWNDRPTSQAKSSRNRQQNIAIVV